MFTYLSKIDASAIDFSEDKTYNEMYVSPSVRKRNENEVNIRGVEVCDEFTAIHCLIRNSKSEMSGCSVNPDAYIRDKSSGRKFMLIGSENIGIYPQTTAINSGEEKLFTLYFEAIPIDSKEIDFIESDKSGWSVWKFYGIKLKKE